VRIIIEIGEGDRLPTHQEYQIIRDILGIPDDPPEEGQPARFGDDPFPPVPSRTMSSFIRVQGVDLSGRDG
jgi:hypothetical protein